MTAYFDEWSTRLAEADPYVLWHLEHALVHDILLVASLPEFPAEFRAEVHATLRKGCVHAQGPGRDGYDAADEADHRRALRTLVSDLHSVFHNVAYAARAADRWGSDSPAAWLANRAEDEREACWGGGP